MMDLSNEVTIIDYVQVAAMISEVTISAYSALFELMIPWLAELPDIFFNLQL